MRTKRQREIYSSDEEEDILDRKRQKINNFETPGFEYEKSIIDEYESKKLIEDMHYELDVLNRKRRKDRELLDSILLGDEGVGYDVSTQTSQTSQNFFGNLSISKLFNNAIVHFSLPIFLLIVNQLTQKLAKEGPKNVDGAAPVNNNNIHSVPGNSDLFK